MSYRLHGAAKPHSIPLAISLLHPLQLPYFGFCMLSQASILTMMWLDGLSQRELAHGLPFSYVILLLMLPFLRHAENLIRKTMVEDLHSYGTDISKSRHGISHSLWHLLVNYLSGSAFGNRSEKFKSSARRNLISFFHLLASILFFIARTQS